MTKEIEALMVLPSESFNFPRHTDSFLMDSWSYSVDISKDTKPKLNTEDELNTISLFYDPCKTQKEQKMIPCSRASTTFKSMERTSNGSSPELTPLENSHIMKLVSDNISVSQSQVSKQVSPGNSGYIQSMAGDSYDKQVISNIVESLLLTMPQKAWHTDSAYPDASTEALGYSEDFVDHSSPVYSDSYPNSPPDRFRNDFQFLLGAPQASQNKSTQMPMVYLNKGQFYPITLQGVDSSAGVACSKVKTVIMAVFENDKSAEMQLKCWNHWHSRQPTAKQRVIDIADYKEVFSGISNVEEVAFNALSFIWNTNEEAKVYIGINSLSTDFSSQKGVKGLPLILQIDTYDFSSGQNRLIHRAGLQVKIFCDKGAERKMRDEERKRSKRRGKGGADSSNNNASKHTVVSSSVGKDSTFFKTLDDHMTQPVLFIPETHYSNMQRLAPPASVEESERNTLKRMSTYQPEESPPISKQPRRETQQQQQQQQQRVLLYVRQESEEVFDALMLNSPTLTGLRHAISEKYGLQEDTIGKIFKKCKRGIFVNMDDNIIEHYSNHSAFLIDISEVMVNHYQITLMEL